MSLTSEELDKITAHYRRHAAAAIAAGDLAIAMSWNLAADLLTDARFTAHHRRTRRALRPRPLPKTPTA